MRPFPYCACAIRVSDQATACVLLACILLASGIVARFFQKVSNDSTPPNNVVNIVESASRMFPARWAFGGIQMNELNSVLPAWVKGCGRSRSIGWRVSTWTDFVSPVVSA